jgi:N-acetylornithine carbamoyltransferase
MSAYAGADVVYAKSWGALPYFGRWAGEAHPRRPQALHRRRRKMALTNNGVFSHCLPLRRNVKATDAVMDSPPASPSTRPRTGCMCRRR